MMGDGLLAVFGAPIANAMHASQAVHAAIEMIENLAVFNIEQRQRRKTQIEIGIGLATGTLIAGYSGTKNRATYTCVGDTVNLAARVEAHTKTAGGPILIDKNTRDALPEDIAVQSLGAVIFKGKQHGVEVFRVLLPGTGRGSA